MRQLSKEEIYAQRFQQSKNGCEYLVRKALMEAKSLRKEGKSAKQSIHFKFNKKSSLFD